MKTEVTGKVQEGKFIPDTAKSFREAFMPFEDKRVVLTVTKRVKRRSLPQLRYYWSVIVPCFQEGLRDLGHDMNQEKVHEFIKANFLTEPVVDEDGTVLTDKDDKVVMTVRSLSDFGGVSTTDFMEFHSKVTRWAAENLGIEIPEPNEQLSMDLTNAA